MTIFFLSTCENVVFILFLIIFFRNKKGLDLNKVLIFICIYSFLTTFTYFYVNNLELRMLINILSHFVFIKTTFSFTYKIAALVTLFRAAFQMILESISYIIINGISQYLTIEISNVEFAFFTYALMALVFITFYKSHFTMGIFRSNNFLDKKILPIVIIPLVQIVNSCLTYFDNSKKTATTVLTFFLMTLMIFFIFRLIKTQQEMVMRDSEQLYLGNLEQLLHSIRGQRHDHMNHLHVIANLISTKSYTEASSYLFDLSTDIDMDYSLLKLDHPSLIALLQTKREFALISSVKLEIIIKHSISEMPLKSYELIQVIGNIIDNAFDEEIASKKTTKKITIAIDNIYNSITVFSINNLNSLISSSQKSNLFSEGYSKKANHKGLGLSTVVNILNRYNAYVEIDSNQTTGTTFFIFIPYKDNR